MTGQEKSKTFTTDEMGYMNIEQAKQRVFGQELNQGKTVRFVFQGKILTDDKKLSSYGKSSLSIVHLFLFFKDFSNSVLNFLDFSKNPHIHAIITDNVSLAQQIEND